MGVDRIGRYQILGELGEGGMAKVLLAHDPRFQRDVAIKVLPRHVLANNMLQERFEREAHTIAALEHSAIVPVYDYGDADGQPYLVMRQMRGGSLADRIKQGPLDLGTTSKIIERIAGALDKAHARGIIHRDLKPSNVLFDDDGAPFLSDFGIVKVMEGTSWATSGIIGTPGFMAPEMFGETKLTASIDIYALGVTLFQMLTGHMPYRADSPVGMMYAHLNTPIPNIRAMRDDLPEAMQAIIERALAKDPAERYPTAGEMAQDLRRASTTHTARPFQILPSEDLDLEHTIDLAAQTEFVEVPARPTKARLPVGLVAGIAAFLLIMVIIVVSVLANQPGGSLAVLIPASATPESDQTQSAAITKVSTAETNDVSTQANQSTATAIPRGFPGNKVTTNAQWTPLTKSFDGVHVALVPVGCAIFGSVASDRERSGSEALPHQVCFDTPFWMDVYEVTNTVFAQFGGQALHSSNFLGDQQPRERITFDEASAFCALRGMRLPTPDEWEYAARGPDSLMYPWGRTLDRDNVVYNANSNGQTAPVGSKPGGVSWAGLYDLAGNVYEWVDEGTELGSGGHEIRGGSWCTGTQSLRAPNSAREFPVSSCSDRGFRCVRDWSPEE